jgi:hypothetical protein
LLGPHKGFSYKLAFVGAIVGISIGLGILNLNISVALGAIMAFIFGFKEIELPEKKK